MSNNLKQMPKLSTHFSRTSINSLHKAAFNLTQGLSMLPYIFHTLFLEIIQSFLFFSPASQFSLSVDYFCAEKKQTNRQTDKQTNRKTEKQTNRQKYKKVDISTLKYLIRPTQIKYLIKLSTMIYLGRPTIIQYPIKL